MRVHVTKAYERPYEKPMAVSAGARVSPDFDRPTDITGWVWCTAEDNRSGWTPRGWLLQRDDRWYLSRDYNALELTIAPGEILDIEFEESGFCWASKENGEHGWVPCDHLAPVQGNKQLNRG
jgi:hypothetical protein